MELFSKLTEAPVSSNFHEDVYDCLVHILGSEKFIKRWALSPYYHLIGTLFDLALLTAVILFNHHFPDRFRIDVE
jgi:hypothetical protein